MAVMKSKSLKKQEQEQEQEQEQQTNAAESTGSPLSIETAITEAGPILIREVPCCNEFVAILQFHYESASGIELPGETSLKPEGMIVGVGPGIAQFGSRIKSQLSLGDVVMFLPKQVSASIDSKSGPYAGRTVRILSEKAILCKLQPISFNVINDA
jgi:co-chaperonin GroES (HSP10)